MPTLNLQPKTKKANRSLVIQVAIILLGLVLGYSYYTQFEKDNKAPIIVTDIHPEDNLGKFKNLSSFDLSIFGEPAFRTLKIIGEYPIQPGTTGRTDIFAPY